MKNRIAIVGLGVFALGALGLAGVATYNFANYTRELLTNVFDRQTTTPSYGDPWMERYRLTGCSLFKENTKGRAPNISKTLDKDRDLKCDNLKNDMSKEKDGKYFIQSEYYDSYTHWLGVQSAPPFHVLTPIAVNKGVYSCDFENNGWKTLYTTMPYGRLGMSVSTDAREPTPGEYIVGQTTTLIVEEQNMAGQIIPHDFNVCPTIGKLEGTSVNGGEIRINWGFVSQKIMNMLIIQPQSISYYDASGKKYIGVPNGDYTVSFPDVFKDYKFKLKIVGVPEAAKAVTPAAPK